MRRRILTTLALSAAVAGAGATGTTPATGATPSGTFGAPRVAVTLPSGCPITNYRLAETGDGIWHGFILSACADHVDRVYYVQRNADGQWLLRGQTFRFAANTAFDVAADGQGTYLVAISYNYRPQRVELIRRNNNGSLSALHTLSTSVDNPEEVAVTASRGNYWVVWTNISGDRQFEDSRLYESRTMGTPVARAPLFSEERDPELALRPDHGVALASTGESGGGIEPPPESSMLSTNDGAHGWQDTKIRFGPAYGSPNALTANGRTYFVRGESCGADDTLPDRVGIARETAPGGSYVKTDLAPTGVTTCTAGGPSADGYLMAQVGSAVWIVGTDSRDKNTLQVWKQAADGSFPVAPAATYPKPVGYEGDEFPPQLIGTGAGFGLVYRGTGDALSQRTLYEVDSQ